MVDTVERARHLNRNTTTEILTIPTVEFKIQERGSIAGMLFKPFKNNKARIKFIYTLARLYRRQETPQRKASKRAQTDFFIFKGDDTPIVSKRKKTTDTFRNVSNDSMVSHIALDRKRSESGGETVKLEFGTLEAGKGKPVQYPCPYPMILPHPVCLICIGNDEFTYEKWMRPIPQKDVFKKHVATHFRLPEYQREFECRHPKCSTKLEGTMHFKRYAYGVHGVSH